MDSLIMKRARIQAHYHLDMLWKTKEERAEVYKWLANEMGLLKEECHIANFTIEQCNQVIEIVKQQQRKLRKGN